MSDPPDWRTRFQIGRRVCRRLLVSAYPWFIMHRFLPIPPPFLSITACGFVGAALAQRLAASPSSAVLACGGVRRSLASAQFSACSPLLALVRACVSGGASWLALGRACGSRCRLLSRLGLWWLHVPRFVGRRTSRHGGRSISPSFPCGANPALNPAPFSRWTLRDEAAQRRLALR